jgi:hypothetical protein
VEKSSSGDVASAASLEGHIAVPNAAFKAPREVLEKSRFSFSASTAAKKWYIALGVFSFRATAITSHRFVYLLLS